jgi:ribosomal-protein-alanine N-acetyltransferase
MTVADLDQVMAIERVAFSVPWSARAYRYEICENEHSVMVVIRRRTSSRGRLGQLARRLKYDLTSPVLGYAGFWLLVDEAHIATIAVHPDWRRRGLGELLLLSLLDQAAKRGARRATLEVRVSNLIAQGLYRKYGFETVSRRKRYYADNDEDAHIMATSPLETPGFQATLYQRRLELYTRLQAEGVAPTRQTG